MIDLIAAGADASERSFFGQVRDNISNFFGDAQDFAELVGAFLEFIGGFLDYLGLFGFFLFLITLVLLSITNAVSPLGKLVNYLTVCIFVCAVYLINVPSIASVETSLRYLSVMMAPLMITYCIKYLVAFGRTRVGGGTVHQRFTRIRGLAEEIVQEAG